MKYNNATIISTLFILFYLLSAGIMVIAVESDKCPNCGMVWNDTCIPFERQNETAYNQEMEASFAPIASNMTSIPDFSNLSWTEAFQSAHKIIRERYAFTDHRKVDWDILYDRYYPAIVDAEKRQDNASIYRTLREYLFAIPDGHLNILPSFGDYGAKYDDIGGGYGLTVSILNSGKVMVSYVARGSKAEEAGIRQGDEVLAWNGTEIHKAINGTSYIWATKKPSTAEGILLHQQRFLTRAPVGTKATITVKNDTSQDPITVELTAFDDEYDTVIQSSFFIGKQINDYGSIQSWIDIKPQISNDTVTVRTLPGGYTYMAIYEESYDVYQPFKEAMLAAINNNSPGIIFDLRFNNGGDDNLASCFAGWLVNQPVFYESVTRYDPGSENFKIISEAWTEPQPRVYEGPVIVMVSPDTISSGEGVPMIMNKTGRGTIISWFGTNGAFGMVGLLANMPLGFSILYPEGASLDQNGTIQVDSDASLAGGIVPNVRVPLNEDTVIRAMNGEDVQLNYALEYMKTVQ